MAIRGIGHPFARQRTFDEDDLAFCVCDAATLVIERFDYYTFHFHTALIASASATTTATASTIPAAPFPSGITTA